MFNPNILSGVFKMSAELFRKVGGRPQVLMGADPNDTENLVWNFGLNAPTEAVKKMRAETPSLHERFPNLGGAWDGKTSINHHDAVRKVLGKDIRAQNQPRGTCGGRSGSQGLNILQCVLIANGKRAKYRPVSHAAIYYFARALYGMDNGNPNNDNDDGVAAGSVPEALAKYGAVHQEEAGDTNYYGAGSDDLACKWGAGKIDKATKDQLYKLASDNIVTAKVRARNAQECADGLAAGGVIIQSDMRGFTMTRDSEGVCRPSGTWAHYHIRSGVRVTPSGRRVFDYNQSWGDNTPSGPPLPGCPGNCFGVEWSVQDQLCRTGEVDIIFGFDLWELEQGNVDIKWRW